MKEDTVSAKYLTLRLDLEQKAKDFRAASPEEKARAHEKLEAAVWNYAGTAIDEGGSIKYFPAEAGRPQIGVFVLPRRSRVRDEEIRYLRGFVRELGDSRIKFTLSAVFLIHSIGVGKPTSALLNLLALSSAGFSELFRERPTQQLAHILSVTEANLGRTENAERIVIEFMESNPDSLLAIIVRANELAQEGELSAAIDLIDKSLENSAGEKSELDDALQKMRDDLARTLYGQEDRPGSGPGAEPQL
jgi:tetratricopeptide (TPR) repeat protein